MVEVYGDPIGFIDENPRGQIGSPEREAVMAAYGEVQRYLTIAGLCLSVLLVIASLCLKNPRLGDQQSLQDAEGLEVKSVSSDKAKQGVDAQDGNRGDDVNVNGIDRLRQEKGDRQNCQA
jgi:SIT family siderophore-iron:H+ symporter-like MFS transporter